MSVRMHNIQIKKPVLEFCCFVSLNNFTLDVYYEKSAFVIYDFLENC